MRTGGVVLLAGLLALSGCGGSAESASESDSGEKPSTFTVGGTLSLLDGDMFRAGGTCVGSDGYGDISPGAVVIVRNSTGDQVGLGELGTGKPHGSVTCVFPFEVPDVADEGERFTVEVSDRGQVPFTREEASDVGLNLG